MTSDPSAAETWRRHLSEALRAIRRARQLSVAEVAQRMGLDRRLYAIFEAGGGRPVNLERIMTFADVTDSDPYAILFSVVIGAPELAVRTCDNKLMTAFAILLAEFGAEVGDDVARIETRAAITAFSAAFKSLADAAVAHKENSSRDWLAEHAAKLRAPRDGEKKL